MNLLSIVRNAVTKSQNVPYTSTNERAMKVAPVELLPKSQSDAIMERLMAKMVQRPAIKQDKDQDLNKRIEKVFELDCFQKMVE